MADNNTTAVYPLPDERQLLDQRREAIDGHPAPGSARWGLALSGGGIRSATFALGVLQALAQRQVDPPRLPDADPGPADGLPRTPQGGAVFRASLLSLFDILSTVSGGGYIGAFMCSLFQPGRLRAASTTPAQAADDAVAVLASGAPRRIHSHAYRGDGDGGSDDIRHAPLAWLRENGRYLVPTGVGDAFYAAALGIRGWIALHVVVGTLLLFVLALLAAVRVSVPGLADVEQHLLTRAAGAAHGSWPLWWSASFAIAALPLAWALTVGVAFWLTEMDGKGRSLPVNHALFGILAAVVVLVVLAAVDHRLAGSSVRIAVWRVLTGLGLAGAVYHLVHAAIYPQAAKQRASLTRQLATALSWTLAVLAIAAVETVGQTAYLWLQQRDSAARVATPAAVVGLLVWLVRQVSGLGGGSSKPGAWWTRLPLSALGGAAGVLIFVTIAAAWALALTVLAWGGADPARGVVDAGVHRTLLWLLTVAFFAIAVTTGRFPGFINLSSLQSFYAARLTRAYLGATNGERFVQSADADPKARTAAEPIEGDNLELSAFVDASGGRLATWAPLHIVNVTLNKTVDPADQLVQRDRKGQPLAVLPWGYAVDGKRAPFAPVGEKAAEIARPLSLGQWIGTSGAAFSTGIGRETSLGMSLLMGAANVRLGTWWQSGAGKRPPPSGWERVGAVLARMFKMQTYVSYEFRARFHGMKRQWQYLSDGGHFENTALYELLRPERGVGFAVACDDGADPDYRFDDLANLIRLARIDLRVEVEVVDAKAEGLAFERGPGRWPVFGRTDDFRPAALSRAAGKPNPLALLLRARSCDTGAVTWVVLVKPAWHADAPADVAQYALQHAAFPQEPTTDQFFDEAQWESYRQLGHFIAQQVLDKSVLDELLGRIDSRQLARRHCGAA